MMNPKPRWIEVVAPAARLATEQWLQHRPGSQMTIALAGALIPLLLGCGTVDESRGLLGTGSQLVRVNEIQAANSATLVDGTYDDWIELYNASDHNAHLEGYFVTDNQDRPFKHMLPPEAVVPAKGFLVLLADGQPERGPLHLSFKLSNKTGGEDVYLADTRGNILDGTPFKSTTGMPCSDPSRQCDFSYARFPDGSGAFAWCDKPTPGASNGGACPVSD